MKSSGEHCAYCGQPLRLVAGFCAACYAPTPVAVQARLVMGQRPVKQVPTPAPTLLGRFTPRPEGAPAKRVRMRLMLWLSVVCLALAGLGIWAHTQGRPLTALFERPAASLSVSSTPNGPTVTSFAAGQTMYVTYSVTVVGDPTFISFAVTPPHMTPQFMTERWNPGFQLRSQPFVATAPGDWVFTVSDGDQVVQRLTLTCTAATS